MNELDSCSHQERKELDLIDLIIVIFKHKWWIISITLLGIIVSMIFVQVEIRKLKRTQQYCSECFILLSMSDIIDIQNVMKNSLFLREQLRNNELMQLLYYDRWDEVNKRWRNDKLPDVKNAIELLRSKVTSDSESYKDTIRLIFCNNNKDVAQKFLKNYVTGLLTYLGDEKKRKLDSMITERQLLYQELVKSSKSEKEIYDELKKEGAKKIFDDILREIEIKNKSYTIILEPTAPEKESILNKENKLKFTAIIAAVLSLFFGIFMSFVVGYIEHIKLSNTFKKQ